MEVNMWYGDHYIEDVVGIRHAIGNNGEKLMKILGKGWGIEGKAEETNNIAVEITRGSGILWPEPDNPTDSEAVAVYLKLGITNIDRVPRPTPKKLMIKIGYLPKDSSLKKMIKFPMQVGIEFKIIQGIYFYAKVLGVPPKFGNVSPDRHTIDINFD